MSKRSYKIERMSCEMVISNKEKEKENLILDLGLTMEIFVKNAHRCIWMNEHNIVKRVF